jgi:dsDNA-specific endonuclease/ATPase MutS2
MTPSKDPDGDDLPPESSDTSDEPAEIAIEDSIDLHGFQPRDIPSVVESYLEAAFERGLRELRLIHGRGIGFQRMRVRQVLESHPLVERFADAPAQRGGWGATVVWLRAPR